MTEGFGESGRTPRPCPAGRWRRRRGCALVWMRAGLGDGGFGRRSPEGPESVLRVWLSRIDGYPIHEVCDCFVAFTAAHFAISIMRSRRMV